MLTVRLGSLLALLLVFAGCTGEGGSRPTGQPTVAASVQPRPTASPGGSPLSSASPVPTSSSEATVGHGGQGDPGNVGAAQDLPSRVVLPDLGIDLPVVSGDLVMEGNPRDYPLCDVAQYLTTYRYPGRDGTTTWIYAHARTGMFLPLLSASTRDDGSQLVGMTVDVYSTSAIKYTYRIDRVFRHATDRSVAAAVPAGERRLVLQTSEGPKGTVPKLQVAATLVEAAPAPDAEAMPVPGPRVCA